MLEEKTVHVPEIRWSNSLFTKKTLDILWKLCGKISGPSPPQQELNNYMPDYQGNVLKKYRGNC